MADLGARVLVLEDEQDLLFLLRRNLEQQGYEVADCATLQAARKRLRPSDAPFDLLLLDVNLPDGTGFDLLQELRRRSVWTPTVFLTARTDEADRLLGFELGGDDYVTKPFSMAELVARLNAIIRRSRRGGLRSFQGDGFRVEFDRFRLIREPGPEVALTYLETELLRYLIDHKGQGISRNELLNEVWGYDRYPTTRTVDTHMLNLRKKLEQDPAQPRHLLTVHGVGYKFID